MSDKKKYKVRVENYNPQFTWYSEQIGKEFEVVPENYYWVIVGGSYNNHVLIKEDCLLIEELPTAQVKFKAMKFKQLSIEHAEALQKHLFSLGYKWGGGNSKPFQTTAKYIYTYDDGQICYGDTFSFFDDESRQEHTLESVTTYSLVPFSNKITIAGTEYDVEFVIEAINKAKERA